MVETATIDRLLAAAVVSKSFRSALLGSPRAAIEGGFAGEGFDLSSRAIDFLASIQVATLREFAEQIQERLPMQFGTAM
jgi:hypothetical protein